MATKTKRESFFWTSFSDLMTSLFLVMLTLFVLVIVLLHREMVQAKINEAIADSLAVTSQRQLEEIERVEKSTRDLEGQFFTFNQEYEKFVLNIDCWFPIDKYDIGLLAEQTRNQLVEAGQEVALFLRRHSDTQYLVIVEGQASKDQAGMLHNYELSFRRALSLRQFWSESGRVHFPGNCELQIAGSGDGTLNVATMREWEERKNQRFLIYIIPKNIMGRGRNTH